MTCARAPVSSPRNPWPQSSNLGKVGEGIFESPLISAHPDMKPTLLPQWNGRESSGKPERGASPGEPRPSQPARSRDASRAKFHATRRVRAKGRALVSPGLSSTSGALKSPWRSPAALLLLTTPAAGPLLKPQVRSG